MPSEAEILQARIDCLEAELAEKKDLLIEYEDALISLQSEQGALQPEERRCHQKHLWTEFSYGDMLDVMEREKSEVEGMMRNVHSDSSAPIVSCTRQLITKVENLLRTCYCILNKVVAASDKPIVKMGPKKKTQKKRGSERRIEHCMAAMTATSKMNTRVCWHANQPGHMSFDCPKLKEDKSAETSFQKGQPRQA